MSFKITPGPEWDILRKSLQTAVTIQKIIPDVTVAILKFHNTLERRVGELFTAPDKLSSVMIGSSRAPSEIGKTFLRYSLQYRSKPIPLSAYEQSTTSVENDKAKIPYRLRPNYVRWTPAKKVRVTKTYVRRGKGVIPRRIKGSRFEGFYQSKGGQNWILARKQQATWITYPGVGEEGTRAPIQQLWGPKLITLASKVYDVDKEVEKAKETLQNDVINAILKSYS